MNFIHKSPKWDNVGAEPTEEIIKKGFTAGYKPPASFFNWFWNRVSNCIKEIQEKLGTMEEHANNYIHPTTHDAEMITQDEMHRFVSDSKIVDWDNKSSKSVRKEVTLTAANWQGSVAPYSYNIPLAEATADNIIEVQLNGVSTDEVYNAIANANIEEGTQAVGSIILYARGIKPTIDLPILIIIRGD